MVGDTILYRLDKHNQILWMTKEWIFHHSIEQTTDGNIIVPISMNSQPKNSSKWTNWTNWTNRTPDKQ